MNPLNRVAGYVVIASALALSACVIGPDRGYGHDDSHRQVTDNRHDEGDGHCNSQDRGGDACREVEHY